MAEGGSPCRILHKQNSSGSRVSVPFREHVEMNKGERNKPKQAVRNRKSEVPVAARRIPQPLDAGDLDTPLDIGSVVELELGGSPKPVCGVVRWIGYYDSPDKPIAGVELEEENPAGTDGVYMKTKLFHCAPKRAMFPYLHRCKIIQIKKKKGKKQEQYVGRMRFYATFGDQKKLIDAEADTLAVQGAARLAFRIPGDAQLLVQVWHQEEEFEDWVDLDQESFSRLNRTAPNKLNVLLHNETLGDKDIEAMNTDLARSMVDAFNLDHVSDEYLF